MMQHVLCKGLNGLVYVGIHSLWFYSWVSCIQILFYVNLPLDYYCTHSTISILTHVGLGLIDQRNDFSSHYRVHHN